MIFSDEPRRSFARYLATAGPGAIAAAARKAITFEELSALRERWSGRFSPASSSEDVLAALGEADAGAPGVLIYQLDDRPGYAYRFVFDPEHDTLVAQGYARLDAPPPPPSFKLPDLPDLPAAVAALGATREEVARWLGEPLDRWGWWPTERCRFSGGVEIEFRHGLAQPP